jgi:Lon-like ATP-dependent protease
MEFDYIQLDEVPGIRIYRSEEHKDPFDIYFCKTKYNVYKVVMGLKREEVEEKMTTRCTSDFEFVKHMRSKYV